MNTRGTIDYDYIKDPGEYYEAHYKALYNQLRYVKGLSEGEAYAQANKIWWVIRRKWWFDL